MYEPIVDKFKYVPESALIELCFKCNLNCRHCGSSLNAYKKSRKGEPLSLTEFYSAIDDLKGLGGKRIGLVGGEPLLYENWEEVAKYASDRNFYVSMISNGMIIDDEMAHKIKKCGIALVALSLDGPETYHNELRGSQMAFKNVLKAIASLKKEGVQVNIITTIMKGNLPLLPEIEKTISTKGVSFWQLQLGIPMGKLSEHMEFVIEPNQLLDVKKFILEAKQRNQIQLTIADSIGYCSQDELIMRNNSSTNGERVYLGCMAGCKAVAIESNGDVKGCLSLQNERFIEGNIRERSLKDIWTDKKSFNYNRNFNSESLGGYCSKCVYANICRGGCTSLAYNTSGHINNNNYCMHIMEQRW